MEVSHLAEVRLVVVEAVGGVRRIEIISCEQREFNLFTAVFNPPLSLLNFQALHL